MNLSLIKFLRWELVAQSVLLYITLKIPVKILLANLDLLNYYPLVCAIYACVLFLARCLLADKHRLSFAKYSAIFTTSMCISWVAFNLSQSIAMAEIFEGLIRLFGFILLADSINPSCSGSGKVPIKENFTEMGHSTDGYGWKTLSSLLAQRIHEVSVQRITNVIPGTTPSNQVSLGDIGINRHSEEWRKLQTFAHLYNGNDKNVLDFCHHVKGNSIHPNTILIYSLSSHKRAINSKIIDAISDLGDKEKE